MAMSDGYIITENYKTNINNVYALGDVTEPSIGFDKAESQAEELYKILTS